jgi:hypothetical protein
VSYIEQALDCCTDSGHGHRKRTPELCDLYAMRGAETDLDTPLLCCANDGTGMIRRPTASQNTCSSQSAMSVHYAQATRADMNLYVHVVRQAAHHTPNLDGCTALSATISPLRSTDLPERHIWCRSGLFCSSRSQSTVREHESIEALAQTLVTDSTCVAAHASFAYAPSNPSPMLCAATPTSESRRVPHLAALQVVLTIKARLCSAPRI